MSPARKTRLYHRIQLAARLLQKTADRTLLETAELTTSQAAVLSIVKAEGGRGQRQIAQDLKQNESAVTAMATRLIALGLLVRERCESDRRVWLLRVTEEGERRLKAIAPAFTEVNARIEAELSDDEIEQLAALLERVSTVFGA